MKWTARGGVEDAPGGQGQPLVGRHRRKRGRRLDGGVRPRRDRPAESEGFEAKGEAFGTPPDARLGKR